MPVKSEGRVGTQLLIKEDTRDRARALSVVMAVPIADIWRDVIEGGFLLKALEEREASRLSMLRATLDSIGVPYKAGLALMIRDRLNYADLFHSGGEVKSLMDLGWKV